ncbi:MAG: FAD-dependent oxidoreductase [Verrucomicrobia bacterium]|nr:FAD-dependent oxidoreductase [Verrucomicrobiota bacterium]
MGCGLLAGVVSAAAVEPRYDVVVYGATPAGIVAAVAAAREGARVAVVEPSPWIGGMVAGGLTRTDTGKVETIGGITREFFARAAERYGGRHLWFAEPHANRETFEAMLRESGATVLRDQSVRGVRREGLRLASLVLADGRSLDGRQFIDASYEGDLMAWAGVAHTWGREGRAQYGEPLAGFFPMELRPQSAEVMASVCSCLGGQGPHYVHGTPAAISARDARGRLIFGVTDSQAEPGSADRRLQAYNFRVVVTRRPELRVPFPRPRNYEPARYELLRRLIAAYPQVRFGRLFHLGEVAAGKYDLNAQGLCSSDLPGGNVGYIEGDPATRARIRQEHLDYLQGMLWYLGHEPEVPAALREETNSWGLCRDEFEDHGHFPTALYVREARRMLGEYVMVQADCQTEITKPDTVAMGSFVIDCHIVQRRVTPEGWVRDEGSFPDAPARPYQIPYRSLTPQRQEMENLLVPVCLSASHVAYCSLRMEPVYMALGHAAGLAAVQALRADQPVQAIDVGELQAKLRAQRAVLELAGAAGVSARKFKGAVLDDAQGEFVGVWTASGYGQPIEGGSRHDANTDKGRKSARFVIPVAVAGDYIVRLAYVAAPNRATNVPVVIAHAGGRTERQVNQRLVPAIDGHFAELGTFPATPKAPVVVTIETSGTDGFVSVDAVQLVPAR